MSEHEHEQQLEAFALKRWASIDEEDLVILRDCLRVALEHIDGFRRSEAERFIDEITREVNKRTPLLPDEPPGTADADMREIAARNNYLVSRGWYLEGEHWQHGELAGTTGVDAAEAQRMQEGWDAST
jgi:hypothetical protein